jgi:hypothetical protein
VAGPAEAPYRPSVSGYSSPTTTLAIESACSATESILRQLEKKGLIERPFRPLSGLGNGRITQEGIEVIEGKRSPPVSILFQHVNSQTDTDNIQKVSTKLNVTIDHSQASQGKPKSPFGWISKWVMDMLEKFGWI